jgi:hypothetical protein
MKMSLRELENAVIEGIQPYNDNGRKNYIIKDEVGRKICVEYKSVERDFDEELKPQNIDKKITFNIVAGVSYNGEHPVYRNR